MHTYGQGHESWGAGIGFDLAFDGETYQSYDASAYRGIKFWATGDVPCLWLRIHTVETTYEEWGGICDEDACTHFAIRLELDDQWREYTLSFDEFWLERYGELVVELYPDQITELTNIQFFVPPSVSPNPSTYYYITIG